MPDAECIAVTARRDDDQFWIRHLMRSPAVALAVRSMKTIRVHECGNRRSSRCPEADDELLVGMCISETAL